MVNRTEETSSDWGAPIGPGNTIFALSLLHPQERHPPVGDPANHMNQPETQSPKKPKVTPHAMTDSVIQPITLR